MQAQNTKHTPTAQDAHLPMTQEIMSAALHVAGLAAGAGKLGEELTAVKRCLLAASDMAREMESRATVAPDCAYYRHAFRVKFKISFPDSTERRSLFLSILARQGGGAPLVYLAAPYTHEDGLVRHFRVRQATACAAWLMAHGIPVFSPLTHGHPISAQTHAYAYEFWAAVNERLLAACDAVLVLDTRSTAASRGVRREVELARKLGIPAQLVTPLGPSQYGISSLAPSVWGWDGVPEDCHGRP